MLEVFIVKREDGTVDEVAEFWDDGTMNLLAQTKLNADEAFDFIQWCLECEDKIEE